MRKLLAVQNMSLHSNTCNNLPQHHTENRPEQMDLNVLHAWLAGTVKTQLALRGDDGYYADLANIFFWVTAPLTFPLTIYVMHNRGQGFTLAVAQTVCMLFLGMQVCLSQGIQFLLSEGSPDIY